MRRVARFLEHAAVERQPAQLAVEIARLRRRLLGADAGAGTSVALSISSSRDGRDAASLVHCMRSQTETEAYYKDVTENGMSAAVSTLMRGYAVAKDKKKKEDGRQGGQGQEGQQRPRQGREEPEGAGRQPAGRRHRRRRAGRHGRRAQGFRTRRRSSPERRANSSARLNKTSAKQGRADVGPRARTSGRQTLEALAEETEAGGKRGKSQLGKAGFHRLSTLPPFGATTYPQAQPRLAIS